MPNTPLKLAGMRMEPPPSLPVARVQRPAAKAAPAPPLEPPGVRVVSQGLRQGSPNLFSVVPDKPNSGVLVLPRMMAPAALTRSTTTESYSGARSRNNADPKVVVIPWVSSRSFTEMGMPCSGPQDSPRCRASWALPAVSRACSGHKVR